MHSRLRLADALLVRDRARCGVKLARVRGDRLMKLNPTLVRGYVQLAIDICRLAIWLHVAVSLITNYRSEQQSIHAEL